MQLRIRHRTRYLFSAPARSNAIELRLSPEETYRQKPGPCSIEVTPVAPLDSARDLFGNLVHSFEVEEVNGELLIEAVSLAETLDCSTLFEQSKDIALLEIAEVEQADVSVHEFLTDSTFVKIEPELWREAVDVRSECPATYGAVVKALSDHIFDSCRYEDQVIHTMTTSGEVQQRKYGTCQDFSHLLTGYCRALGIPARYISGYLWDPGLSEGHPEFTGAEVSHAWVEVFVPGLDWIGIDPTNRKWVDEHYVSVAFGRDYHDVAPIRGSLQGGGKRRSLEVSVEVEAI